MSGEIEGAAEEFERSADWLRDALRGLVAAVDRAAEPEVEEWVQERRTTRGAQGRQFGIRISRIAPPGPHHADGVADALASAADAMTAAGWRTEIREDARGPRLLAQQAGFEVGLFGVRNGGLSAWGKAPTVWFRTRWARPPRAATPETLAPGYELCPGCDGWGSCFGCEGLGFLDGRQCPECGLGMDCSYCGGSGRRRADR
ncbi:hypothetical protein HHL19_22275 [Streptomyces sp. R302]|uniref:hypothetical protein n=1 Tax=unclassified Streptomyces TaxID=2593676 RepID=UPI00145D9E5A|nr:MULTISPECIES: hypothetical protein [unclassified Streptomyces]NML51692.1 hypothetical protein [Streptomyces sp. R301]NML81312.1 hypothetical protein [Streptomyces sp. R302]